MQLPSKLFLDGGDPDETKEAHALLQSIGYHGLDGQTTNPSLIAKRLLSSKQTVVGSQGKKITKQEALDEYKRIVQEMAEVVSGPISIQVFANHDTTADEMIEQAKQRATWIPNYTIKFPCTRNGLIAAESFCHEGSLNMTLVFSQSQAAAVHQATRGVLDIREKHPIFVSPFVGRLDDRGENGMDVVRNILSMYRTYGEGHVQVITASVRTVDHFLESMKLGCDIVTIPMKILKLWVDMGHPVPDESYHYDKKDLVPLPYQEIRLDRDFLEYDILHELTDTGVGKFWDDWMSMVSA